MSGPTEGARSHTLAEEIGRTAEGFGADVVVLGLTRSRLARHRLAPSLRSPGGAGRPRCPFSWLRPTGAT